MQVKLNLLNNDKKLPNKVSFGHKGIHDPERLLTDETMKVISDAISATGIAGIELQQQVQDFAQKFDKEICRSELKHIDADVIAMAMKYAPGLIDTILTDKNSNGRTRAVRSDSMKSLIDTYAYNPELTEKLLLEKDKKGNYKYTAPQIATLVEFNSEYPDLYPLARKNFAFVYDALKLYGPDNQPLYGINDIKKCSAISKLNADFTLKLMKYKDFEGRARFSPNQIKYFVENFDENDDFLSFILDAKQPFNPQKYRFSSKQIMKLTKIAKDEKTQKLVQKLTTECSQEYYYGKMHFFLDSGAILDIMKNPEISFDEVVKKTNEAPNLSLQVYALLNGKIDALEIPEILSVRDKMYKERIYSPQDLLKFPHLFTEEANERIKKVNERTKEANERIKEVPEYVYNLLNNIEI